MKIAFALQPWDRVVPGVEEGSAIALIAYHLASRLAADHDISIYANRGPGQASDETDHLGIAIKRFGVPSKPLFQLADRVSGFWNVSPPLFATPVYYRQYAKRLALAARAQQIDILHLNTFFQHASIARHYNPSAQLVLHMHDQTVSRLPADYVRPHLDNIDKFLAVSNHVAERFKSHFPEHAKRCFTLYNGVDTERFRPVPIDKNRPKQPRILHVSRISPEKGTHVLIAAFTQVLKQYPDCQLDIVGAPGLLPYALHLGLTNDVTSASLRQFYGHSLTEKIMRQLINKDRSYTDELRRLTPAGVEKNIHYHGPCPNAQLLQLYNDSDMLVFPSVIHEPFGMPITEAMACARPVVATDGGGIPELITHGETGLLAKRNDPLSLSQCMLQLLDNPVQATQMGKRARQHVLEKLSFDLAARQLAAYYLLDEHADQALAPI